MKYSVFSFHRYALLLKRHLVEDRRRQFTLTGISAAVVVLAFAFMVLIFSVSVDVSTPLFSEDTLMPMSLGFKALAAFVFLFMFSYQAAHSMPFRATKARQIAYSTLPVTTAERYAVAVTISTVVTAVECFVGFLIADTIIGISSGHFLIFADNGIGEILPLLKDSAYSVMTQPAAVVSYVLSALTAHSWYTLAATLFRRHPFLIGTLIYMMASLILDMISIGFLGMFDFYANPDEIRITLDTIDGWLWVSNAISTAIVVIFYLLSYIRIRRMQI